MLLSNYYPKTTCQLSYLSRSNRLLEQLAADEPAADFAGAGANLVELGVPEQPAGGEIVDVAIAAQALDGLQRQPGRLLRREQNGAGGVLAGGVAAIAGLRHGIDVSPRRRQRHVHVGDLALHQLEGADGLAELLAVVNVGHH